MQLVQHLLRRCRPGPHSPVCPIEELSPFAEHINKRLALAIGSSRFLDALQNK